MQQLELPLRAAIKYSVRFLVEVETAVVAYSPDEARAAVVKAYGRQIAHLLDVVPENLTAAWRENEKGGTIKSINPKPRNDPPRAA